MRTFLAALAVSAALLSCAGDPPVKSAESEAATGKSAMAAGYGKCKRCGCQGWRGDSGNPEKCVNIRVPTKDLCAHVAGDHR